MPTKSLKPKKPKAPTEPSPISAEAAMRNALTMPRPAGGFPWQQKRAKASKRLG